MKFTVSIFMILQILSGSTFIPEMCKVPDLISHFYEHQKTESISFINFLHEHYCCEDKGNNQHNHEKLPLKHGPNCCNHSQNTVQYFTYIDDLNISIKENKASFFIEQYCLHETDISNSVWQPPRIA